MQKKVWMLFFHLLQELFMSYIQFFFRGLFQIQQVRLEFGITHRDTFLVDVKIDRHDFPVLFYSFLSVRSKHLTDDYKVIRWDRINAVRAKIDATAKTALHTAVAVFQQSHIEGVWCRFGEHCP